MLLLFNNKALKGVIVVAYVIIKTIFSGGQYFCLELIDKENISNLLVLVVSHEYEEDSDRFANMCNLILNVGQSLTPHGLMNCPISGLINFSDRRKDSNLSAQYGSHKPCVTLKHLKCSLCS